MAAYGDQHFGEGSFGSLGPDPGSVITDVDVVVLIDGQNYNWMTRQDGIRISERLGAVGTCDLVLETNEGVAAFSPGQEVKIVQEGRLLWAGRIVRVELEYPSLSLQSIFQRFQLRCQDWNSIPARRIIDASYERQSIGAIVRSVISSHLAAEGISEGAITEGLTVGPIRFRGAKISAALDRVTGLGSLSWFIDHERRLNVVDRTTLEAPRALFDTVDVADFSQISYVRDLTRYRNSHIVRGGHELGAARVERFTGDDETRSFTVALPIGAAPRISLDGVDQVVGISGVETGADWFWRENSPTVSQNADLDPPGGYGEDLRKTPQVLEVEYQPRLNVSVKTTDEDEVAARKAIEGGTGLYETQSRETGLDSASLSAQFGEALLRQSGEVQREIRFRSNDIDYCAGTWIQMSSTKFGFIEEFMITSVDMQSRGEGHWEASVRAVASDRPSGFADFWKRVGEALQGYFEDEEDVEAIPQGRESVVVSDAGSNAATPGVLDPWQSDPFSYLTTQRSRCGGRFLVGSVRHSRGPYTGAIGAITPPP